MPGGVALNVPLRDSDVSHRNKACVTDMTYIRTRGGGLPLSEIMDCFPEDHWWGDKAEARSPAGAQGDTSGGSVEPSEANDHSTHPGSRYRSDNWHRLCRTYKIKLTLSRRGNRCGIAVAESFFGNIKKESVRKKIYNNREAVRADISGVHEAIYNPKGVEYQIGWRWFR